MRLPLGLCCALAALSVGNVDLLAQPATPPRLAVVISVDQLRYDYLDRFNAHFSPDGFRRLRAGGADFTDAHYRHGVTKTAPGHALILSGVHANVSGIVGNEWVDLGSLQTVASVEDPTSPLVGAEVRPGRSPGGVIEAKEGRSPRRFEATTVGDGLKLRYGPQSRVISVANKDRSAILMGGRMADGVFWIDRGRFVSSQYYGSTLPAWVEAFNGERRIEAAFGQEWTRTLPLAAYEALGPDDAPGEATIAGFGPTFPKRIDGGAATITDDFYEAYTMTPLYTELLGEFAKLAVRSEKLGTRAGTDLLCIGFSQLDHSGHNWGPDSHEVLDTLVRMDRVIAGLLRFLDDEVGAGRYVVVLTADHGVAPLPERVLAFNRDVPAGRLNMKSIDQTVSSALDAAFGAPDANHYWMIRDGFGFHLRPEILKAKGITLEAAAAVVQGALAARPEISLVYTRADFASGRRLDPIGERMRLSYHAKRSPDVVYVTRPFFFDRSPYGVNHGSPYNYDSHVPLLWYGAGVPAGRRSEPAGVDDLAPTLSKLLGLPAPPQAEGRQLF